MTQRFLIGIDGGGTGTRARLCAADGAPLGLGEAGASSLSHGEQAAWQQILHAIQRAFAQASMPCPPWSDCALAAGLAGANDPAQAAAFRGLNPGFAPLLLETDSFTALVGAHAGRHGVILIAGTGSVAEVWRPDGARRISGGWGFPVGDEGSGAWLGLQAVRLAQQALDGRGSHTPLTEAVCAAIGREPDTMLAWCAQARQTAYATIAPLVFQHEPADPRATALLQSAADHLALLVHALDPHGELPVVCSGSIARRLQPRLPGDLRARCAEAAGDAADGALQLLRAHLAGAGE
ncbi:BadF/BadG/BcrA/BcrD ATPase family protein [Ideonella sp. YS5]|uniref:BadF/BadG/BcrA/BcrD ATPase family protein n=1 Tax=Ideonella sp. YS5 TaxID=3453714 RepID=UPI003EEC9A60